MTGVNGTVYDEDEHECADDPYCAGLPKLIPFPQSRGLTVDQVIDALYHGPEAAQFRLFFEYGHQEWKRYATDERTVSAVTELVVEGNELPFGEDWNEFYRLIEDAYSFADDAYSDATIVKRHVPVLISHALEKKALPYSDDDDAEVDAIVRRVEEVADTDFVKLLIPLCGDDFETIDAIVKRSRMRSDRWSHEWVGKGHYYKRVIFLAAVEWYREYQATQPSSVAAPASSDDVFAAATQTVQDFMTSAAESVTFLVEDYIATGGITSLSARVKLGKTELAMHLVESVASGAPIFGKSVTRAKVLYLTEQASSVRSAITRVGLEENRDVWITPWHKVMKLSWDDIVASAVRYCQAHDIKLLVVDTLSRFARIKDENDSAEAMRVMAPLHRAIADARLAILTIRHDRKSVGDLSDSARGSSAYNGEADILLGVRMPNGKHDLEDDDDAVGANAKDRRRLLVATSRYGEPDDLLVKLTTDNEYIVLGQPQRVKAEDEEQALLKCIPFSRDQARKWPEVQKLSGLSKLRAKEVLDDLVGRGTVLRDVIDRRTGAIGVWQAPTAHVTGQGAADA